MSAKLIEELAARVHDLERRLYAESRAVTKARRERDLWKARAMLYRTRPRS